MDVLCLWEHWQLCKTIEQHRLGPEEKEDLIFVFFNVYQNK